MLLLFFFSLENFIPKAQYIFFQSLVDFFVIKIHGEIKDLQSQMFSAVFYPQKYRGAIGEEFFCPAQILIQAVTLLRCTMASLMRAESVFLMLLAGAPYYYSTNISLTADSRK